MPRKPKNLLTQTDISKLNKREQKILKEWLETLDEIEEMLELVSKLREKEGKLASKVAKVLKKVEEEAVAVDDVVVKLVKYKHVISRPKYKELYEKALPYLSTRMQNKLEKLRESMVKYKMVEKPKVVRSMTIASIVERVKNWFKTLKKTIKGFIDWIKQARAFRKEANRVLKEARVK